MSFTHVIDDETHTVDPHPHDTVEEARACEQHHIDQVEEFEQWQADYNADLAHERWLENGGPHADRIAYENEQDRLREDLGQ